MKNILKPALIISESKCRQNIRKMLNKANANGIALRPHFKTHQNITVGNWFKEEGVDRIAVSSVSMATKFANAGWKDIMIAFPFNVREVDEINELAATTDISITLSCSEAIPLLAGIKNNLSVYLKIDTGSHRTGFNPSSLNEILEAAEEISKHPALLLKGFVAHAGHTYSAAGHDEIRSIYRIGVDSLIKLKKAMSEKFDNLNISWGDTPTCSIIDDFPGVDEIRPGNFVYYDLMQLNLKVCKENDIAMIMACPVVAKHKDRNEIVIYGGAVHLSKELLSYDDGKQSYGRLVELKEDGSWMLIKPDMNVIRLSQEHGILKVSDEVFDRIQIGSLIGIMPVHACLAADLLHECFFVD